MNRAEARAVLHEYVNIRGDYFEEAPLASMIQRLAAALDVELRDGWREDLALHLVAAPVDLGDPT